MKVEFARLRSKEADDAVNFEEALRELTTAIQGGVSLMRDRMKEQKADNKALRSESLVVKNNLEVAGTRPTLLARRRWSGKMTPAERRAER